MVEIEMKKLSTNSLPGFGLNLLFSRYKLLPDLLFFLIVFALPSSFMNLVSKEYFYDIRLLFLLSGIGCCVLYCKNIKKICYIPAGKSLVIVVVFICFKLFHSLFYQNVQFVEIVTVFRSNFSYPLITLGFLLYTTGLSVYRIVRLISFLFIGTLFQGTLYLISNLSNIDFFANMSGQSEQYQGVVLLQNMGSIPAYNQILFASSLLVAFTSIDFRKHYLWFVPLAVTVVSIVRNQIVVSFCIVMFLYIFGQISSLKINIGKMIRALLIISVSMVIIVVAFPLHVNRTIDKFGIDIPQMRIVPDYLQEGTYKFRLTLIEEAYERTMKSNNLLFGNGYVREAEKGEYDFVFGTDTFIPSVLYTEGIIGLLLRIIPYVVLLIFSVKNMRSMSNLIASLAVLILSILSAESINVVQTRLFTMYNEFLFVIYLLILYVCKTNEATKIK